MLWIGSAEAAFISEIEQRTGLKARIADGKSRQWKKNLKDFSVIVLDLPAPVEASDTFSRETIQEALTAAEGPEGVSIVLNDRHRVLDESLIGPLVTRFHYVSSDNPAEVAEQIRAAAQQCAAMRSAKSSDEVLRKWLIGESRVMRELRALIRLVAPRNSTVLITGETGTGKERIARALHAVSHRADTELVAVNCGALPENLVEAELFGHTRGAFTGAAAPRTGHFERAHKGTLFLDEIGEIPFGLQSRLLRVLQERELQRIGSSETIKIDTRVIAATNTDLTQEVARKRFREDLYYRLNVVPIVVPPLRERRSDIPVLAEHFIENVCMREGLPAKVLSTQAMRRLIDFDWPGNVRQLENTIETAVTLSGTRQSLFLGDIDLSDSRTPSFSSDDSDGNEALVRLPASGMSFEQVIGRVERLLLSQALQSCGGNKAKAATMLGMKRTTLLYKMKVLEGPECAA